MQKFSQISSDLPLSHFGKRTWRWLSPTRATPGGRALDRPSRNAPRRSTTSARADEELGAAILRLSSRRIVGRDGVVMTSDTAAICAEATPFSWRYIDGVQHATKGRRLSARTA